MREEYTRKGSIYQHVSGEFRIRERKGRAYEIEFQDRPSLWISTGTRDFDKADAFAKKMLHSRMRYLPNERILLKDFAKGFFTKTDEGSFQERCVRFGKHHEPEYFTAQQARVDNYILPAFGDSDIRRISDVMIENWYVGVTSFAVKGRELSDDSKVKILGAFSFVMEEARRRGIIEENPCDKVQKITVRSNRRGYFTEEEIALLFPDDRAELMRIWHGSLMWALYFSLLVDTGLRAGELAGLSVDSFDGNGGVHTETGVSSRTRQLKNRIKTTGRGKEGKLGLLSDYTLALLDEYLDSLDDRYLFKVNGRFVYCELANKNLRSACKRAGVDIGSRTQYCFRHSFDTYMLNNLGELASEEDVRELMGHTGYRPEYDHRTPEQMLFRMQKVKPLIDQRRKSV